MSEDNTQVKSTIQTGINKFASAATNMQGIKDGVDKLIITLIDDMHCYVILYTTMISNMLL